MESYDDAYNTCAYTHCTLRIGHALLDTDEITGLLGLQPSWCARKGEYFPDIANYSRTGIWGFSSEHIVASRDLRRHLDWLLSHIDTKKAIMDGFRARGYEVVIWCDWVRSGGTGGPTLSPTNMRGLADLELELMFEFWSESKEEANKCG